MTMVNSSGKKSLHLFTTPVEEYTTPNPITTHGEAPLDEIKRLMSEHGIRHLPIVENDKVIGIVSDRDIRIALGLGAYQEEIVAKDLMTESPYTVNASTALDEVAYQMSKEKIGSAIVNDADGSFLGIFTSTDALNALIEIIRGINPNE